MKFATKIFGCKVNQAETQNLIRELIEKDFEVVDFDNKPEVIFVNTCSVTQKGQSQSTRFIRQAKKNNPQSLVIATGCLPSDSIPQEVDLWIKNKDKKKLPALVTSFVNQKKKVKQNKNCNPDLKSRVRALVKIQEGCNNFCAYCIVPYLRGRERSFSPNSIISEIKRREKEGFKEIVLVGTNIARYDYRNHNLVDLLDKILSQTKIERIRLSSFWPSQVDDDLLKLFNNPRLCRHLHLSIQSGSNQILKKMNRDYTHRDILKLVSKIYKKVPNIILTTDFIVGFPSETDKDFEMTYKLCQQAKFFKNHVFRYSPRKGTRASEFENQVDEKVKKDRAKKLTSLDKNNQDEILNQYVGKEIKILIENKRSEFQLGLTDNYLKVYFRDDRDLAGKIEKVRIIKKYRDGLSGRLTS